MTDKPIRIQLSRKKGWRMPPNTVKVDRSTKWGNPWPVGKEGPLGRTAPDALGSVGFFRAMLDDTDVWDAAGYPEKIGYLRGKNLACWCPLPKPGEPDICHAAVLLEIANRPTKDRREG